MPDVPKVKIVVDVEVEVKRKLRKISEADCRNLQNEVKTLIEQRYRVLFEKDSDQLKMKI
jgi:hypothetical protein